METPTTDKNDFTYKVLSKEGKHVIHMYLEYKKGIFKRELNRLELWKKKDLNAVVLRKISKKRFGLIDNTAEIEQLQGIFARNSLAIEDLLNKNTEIRIDRIEELLSEYIVNSFAIINAPINIFNPELDITKIEKLRAIEEDCAAIEALRRINPEKAQDFEQRVQELQVTYMPETVNMKIK